VARKVIGKSKSSSFLTPLFLRFVKDPESILGWMDLLYYLSPKEELRLLLPPPLPPLLLFLLAVMLPFLFKDFVLPCGLGGKAVKTTSLSNFSVTCAIGTVSFHSRTVSYSNYGLNHTIIWYTRVKAIEQKALYYFVPLASLTLYNNSLYFLHGKFN
jgi:hypothetical protein